MTAPRTLLTVAVETLSSAGVPAARADAEQLLAAALGVPRTRLAAVETVDADTAVRFAELVTRRSAREPLQHLVGTVSFRYIEVAVDRSVRAETGDGSLVDAVLPVLRASPYPIAVDLCAGSGAPRSRSPTRCLRPRCMPSSAHPVRSIGSGETALVRKCGHFSRRRGCELAARADRPGRRGAGQSALRGDRRGRRSGGATIRPTPSSRARTDSPCCRPWSVRRDSCSARGRVGGRTR